MDRKKIINITFKTRFKTRAHFKKNIFILICQSIFIFVSLDVNASKNVFMDSSKLKFSTGQNLSTVVFQAESSDRESFKNYLRLNSDRISLSRDYKNKLNLNLFTSYELEPAFDSAIETQTVLNNHSMDSRLRELWVYSMINNESTWKLSLYNFFEVHPDLIENFDRGTQYRFNINSMKTSLNNPGSFQVAKTNLLSRENEYEILLDGRELDEVVLENLKDTDHHWTLLSDAFVPKIAFGTRTALMDSDFFNFSKTGTPFVMGTCQHPEIKAQDWMKSYIQKSLQDHHQNFEVFFSEKCIFQIKKIEERNSIQLIVASNPDRDHIENKLLTPGSKWSAEKPWFSSHPLIAGVFGGIVLALLLKH